IYLRGFESHEFGRHEVTETVREEGGDDRVWREHGLGAQMLLDLGVRRMRLMSNTSASFAALSGYGLEIVERVPLITPVVEDTARASCWCSSSGSRRASAVSARRISQG